MPRPFEIPHLMSKGTNVSKVSPYAKALAGFAAGAIVAYLGATDGGVTSQEWLQIIAAGLGGSGLVYIVPNKAKR